MSNPKNDPILPVELTNMLATLWAVYTKARTFFSKEEAEDLTLAAIPHLVTTNFNFRLWVLHCFCLELHGDFELAVRGIRSFAVMTPGVLYAEKTTSGRMTVVIVRAFSRDTPFERAVHFHPASFESRMHPKTSSIAKTEDKSVFDEFQSLLALAKPDSTQHYLHQLLPIITDEILGKVKDLTWEMSCAEKFTFHEKKEQESTIRVVTEIKQ